MAFCDWINHKQAMRRQRRECERKIGWHTVERAEREKQRLEQSQGNVGLQVYYCPFCQLHHVGHDTPQRKRVARSKRQG